MIYGYLRLGYHPGQEDSPSVKFQEQHLKNAGAQEIYTEFGVNPEPSKLDFLINQMQAGDKLIVSSVGRISRDTKKCLAILEHLRERGIEVRMLKECLSTADPQFPIFAKILLQLSEL